MLTAHIHLRLLPQVWGRLVDSAGQKFQTSTIYIRNENATRCTAYSNTSDLHVLNYQRRLISPFLSV